MSINMVFIQGNLGDDPEVRYTPQGTPVASASVATNRTWTDKETQKKKTHTEWHRVILWNRHAEIVEQYCKKGDQVTVVGRLQTRSWEKDGVKRFTTEIVVSQLTLGPKRSAAEQSGSAAAGAAKEATERPQQQAPASDDAPDIGSYLPENPADDDIPF